MQFNLLIFFGGSNDGGGGDDYHHYDGSGDDGGDGRYYDHDDVDFSKPHTCHSSSVRVAAKHDKTTLVLRKMWPQYKTVGFLLHYGWPRETDLKYQELPDVA